MSIPACIRKYSKLSFTNGWIFSGTTINSLVPIPLGNCWSLFNSTNSEGLLSLILLISQLPLENNCGEGNWLWFDSFGCCRAIYCWLRGYLLSSIIWCEDPPTCDIISVVDNSARLPVILLPSLLLSPLLSLSVLLSFSYYCYYHHYYYH